MILYLIISGLFLGWFLGTTGAANIFGTAVLEKVIKFKFAVAITGVFIVMGAVLHGEGPAETISKFGSVTTLSGALIIAVSAGFTLVIMSAVQLNASVTQAVVGGIFGWLFYTHQYINTGVTIRIFSAWLVGPLLGAVFTIIFIFVIKKLLSGLKIHIIWFEVVIRWVLYLTIALSAYSFGANNIANIVGVFGNHVPSVVINLGFVSLNGMQLFLFIAGITVIIGLFFQNEKILQKVNNNLLSISPISAIVVGLVHALVLFIFSSKGLSHFFVSVGLPEIPLIPISSSQIIVGCVLGLAVVKNFRDIEIRAISQIAVGWMLTLIVSSLITLVVLFIAQNLFNINVHEKVSGIADQNLNLVIQTGEVINVVWPTIAVISIIGLLAIGVYIYRQQKLRLLAEKELNNERHEYFTAQQALMESNLRSMQLENDAMANKLEFKYKELMFYALSIVEQREYLNATYLKLKDIQKLKLYDEISDNLNELINNVKQKMSFSSEVETFNLKVDQMNRNFAKKLNEKFPDLTEGEVKLIKLLRLGFSSKEIAHLLNISLKSVEMNRYRLRKKLGLDKGTDLTNYINQI